MSIYEKLVRDRIPEIIRQTGRSCQCRVLGPEEYRERLDQKLAEELQEYRESGELAELADLAEVLHAIVQARGLTVEQFEEIRLAKRRERGGFAERLLLVGLSG